MKKYENFCAALENLKDIFEPKEPYSNIVGVFALLLASGYVLAKKRKVFY